MYKKMPHTLKLFSKRLCNLAQEVAEMKHYWKIRCKERKTFVNSNHELRLLLERMQSLDKRLCEMFNRKRFIIRSLKQHKKHGDIRCYPLFISRNECARLMHFLRPRKMGRPKRK
jgi:hypothetical protein